MTPKLLAWKSEIEATGHVPLLIAYVQYDRAANTLSLAEGTAHADLFSRYLQEPAFLAQFNDMYAVSVTHKAGTPAYLIMVNGAREDEIHGNEEALLAHEFGHAWVKANGYPSPMVVPGTSGCLPINTADILQHELIRRELDRRGIDHRTFWIRSLDRILDAKFTPPSGDSTRRRCLEVRQIAELVDVRLGLTAEQWPALPRYEERVRRYFPGIEAATSRLTNYIRSHDVSRLDIHRDAIPVVFAELRTVFERKLPKDRPRVQARTGSESFPTDDGFRDKSSGKSVEVPAPGR